MNDNRFQNGIAEALRMLAIFESVGVTSFDITHTNIRQEKRGFRPAQTVAQARTSMPYLVQSAARRQNNVIIRPRASGVTLVQLDDLTVEHLSRTAGDAFLTLQTSDKGTQAWVAVAAAPAGFAARLKEGLHADREASGATRMAGTWNFKPAYAPDFPVVRILSATLGLVVTPAMLESRGLVAPGRPAPPTLPSAASDEPRTEKWPDYQRCLDGAPIGPAGNPKRTSADFVWCKIALSWGHGIEATAARLMQESSKARENGEAYALKTADHADYAARQRNAQPRPPRIERS